MKRIAGAFIAGLALATASPAARADDASDARAVIAGQLEAFKAQDGAQAYGFAAPNIRHMFTSPEIFMSMVERGYPPVYHSSNATFGPFKADAGSLRQEVFLSDTSGQSWIASYTLQRQPDGSLKITGCQIRKGDDVSA